VVVDLTEIDELDASFRAAALAPGPRILAYPTAAIDPDRQRCRTGELISHNASVPSNTRTRP
jgi:hypothetical protein